MAERPLPTPDLSHFSESDYENFYEPAQDSFLLLDALWADRTFLKDRIKPTICVEIGPGSGCITTYLAQLLGNSIAYIAADINPHACAAARKTFRQNIGDTALFDVIRSDLLSAAKKLNGKVDVLIFNPPYVPTGDDELDRDDIYAAWAGGPAGTSTLDRLLPDIKSILSPRACFYLVAVAENKPQDIARRMMQDGFEVEIVAKRRAFNEQLYILRFWRV